MSSHDQVSKNYIVHLINNIDNKNQSGLTKFIENITISRENVTIIIKSKLTSENKKIADTWKSSLEKDKKISQCSIIFTEHNAPSPREKHSHENSQFSNKYDLSHLGKIIFIASGKGGVGKSTISNNIASLIAEMGYSVGLMDADVYGPSQPKMLGLDSSQVRVVNNKIRPEKIGNLTMMSMGMLFPDHEAIIWRGPMLMKAIQQLLLDVEWETQDYFIVDLPPGTGDVHITLAQKVKISGAVVVSTPQDISLIDAKKAIALFKKTNTPILGLIENMSYFECTNCGQRHEIFSNGGVASIADREGFPVLGTIPLLKGVMESGDQGRPFVSNDNYGNTLFTEIVKNIFQELDKAL